MTEKKHLRRGKNSRSLLGVVLVLALVFVMAVPTMAEPDPDGDPEPVAMDGIALSETSLSLSTITQSAHLTVTPIPDNASYDTVIWESADASIAVVTEDAEDMTRAAVTAVANGSTNITVTVITPDGEMYNASCAVTVSLCNGFQQDPDGDDWYYYKDGQVDTSVTDVRKGTVDGISGWWNVENGKVTPGVTVARNSNGWWYIDANGMVDFSYNGFAKNSNGSWYCENGKVTFSKQDIIQDTTGALGEKNAWYYVIGSKVRTDFTGLSNFRNSHGWWYIENGKVDFTHNGVDKNKNGWWYVTGGKVQFNFTGLANYRNASGWWYIRNGKVDFTHNGLEKNKNGWWYIKKGKVDFTHNSVDKNKNGWWYVTGGKVQFGFTGLANYRNDNGWWYIKNGKVDFTHNGVDKNKNGWWYVTGGKVRFGYTGLANYRNASGWWYIKSGKVDFTYTGIGSNKNGEWYIKNGKVDFSYNGTYTAGKDTYTIVNGKAKKKSGGYLICIDPGHQTNANSATEPNGPGSSTMKAKVSSGTKGVTSGLAEYQLNLTVGLKLRTELESRGYEVLMTRTTNNVNISNVERTTMANDAKADVLVHIHANGDSNSSTNGITVACTTSKNPYNSLYSKNKSLATSILNHMVSKTGAKNLGLWQTDDMTGLNWAEMPAVIVEMGFMTNSSEDKKMATDSYQNLLVQGMADGIDEYFK